MQPASGACGPPPFRMSYSSIVLCDILLALLAVGRNACSPSSSRSSLLFIMIRCTVRDVAVVVVAGLILFSCPLVALAVVLANNILRLQRFISNIYCSACDL